MSACDILVIANLNMDLILEQKNSQQTSRKRYADSFTLSPGGNGYNEAVAAARMGATVALAGMIGSDSFGAQLKAGEKMLLLFESANFDESVFLNAERFDVGRTPNPHVAFGFGTHFCLGNQLARLEGRIMFEQLFARLPDMELATDAPLQRRAANFVSGLESMPVRFNSSAPSAG